MTYKVAYTRAAIEHIKNIADWYNRQQKGLGTRFKTALKAEIKIIQKGPFSRSFRYDGVRFAVVKKFPYAAHYTVTEEKKQIIIHAVFAFSENPKKWND
ncbi:MAG: hypothetical protein KF862_18345 [Chitinophagaceae bacterium]|nr:hypothetical protein [Chitinophagaceae bacterium]